MKQEEKIAMGLVNIPNGLLEPKIRKQSQWQSQLQ